MIRQDKEEEEIKRKFNSGIIALKPKRRFNNQKYSCGKSQMKMCWGSSIYRVIQNESDNFIRGQFQFYDYETKLFDEIF